MKRVVLAVGVAAAALVGVAAPGAMAAPADSGWRGPFYAYSHCSEESRVYRDMGYSTSDCEGYSDGYWYYIW